jgi:hypothetical protein
MKPDLPYTEYHLRREDETPILVVTPVVDTQVFAKPAMSQPVVSFRRSWQCRIINIFLAGATGAIGKRLLPQLLARGHQVTTTTRTSAKLNAVRAAGAKAVLRHSRKLGTIRTSIRNSRLPTGCAPKLQNTLSPLPDRRVPVDLSPGATWLA